MGVNKKQIQNKTREIQKIFMEYRQKLKDLEKELCNTIIKEF